ncbi:hypothetical protein P7H60_06350 [Vagococcus carniphilus]|uniref:hypothetical protein n=1 Tax=Vagococcus carniphilus TaxID=218144 RepID=UPI00288EE064|nr:hypothetical protein [Vagococcus carniphilus]MDT2848777.1 hypothetical protein [Vagococcus carniphilus]
MKNELTSEEWLVLSEYINLGGFASAFWDLKGVLEEKNKVLKSAIEKVNDTTNTIINKKG